MGRVVRLLLAALLLLVGQGGLRAAQAAGSKASAATTARFVIAAEAGRMGGTTIGGVDHATASMIKYSNKNPAAGYYAVIGHGSPTDIAGRSASEVAQRIGTSSGSQDIRLPACRTGCPTGTFAQDLANTMGVRVMAPTTDIGASTRGNTLTIFDGGEWRWFTPEG